MKALTFLSIACPLLMTASCAIPSVKALPPDPEPAELMPATAQLAGAVGPQVTPKAMTSKLYARDGSVISEQEPGTVSVSTDPGQAAGTESGSRWTLLEQYQAVMQSNEELEVEIRHLSRALELSQQREIELGANIDNARAEMTGLNERIETLSQQNVELASRLTTAQIRRLQSEKLLLESKIDWKRVEAMINVPAEGEAQAESVNSMPDAGMPDANEDQLQPAGGSQ